MSPEGQAKQIRDLLLQGPLLSLTSGTTDAEKFQCHGHSVMVTRL